MDRNLGATSATPGDVGANGLCYQWGRKDPFLGPTPPSGSSVAESTITWPSRVSTGLSTGTIEYATAHPTTYIEGTSSTDLDWYYSSRDNTLWTTSDKIKSIYDPCPSGWRVPDGGQDGVWSKALGYSSSTTLSDSCVIANGGMNLSDYFGSDKKIWYPISGCLSNGTPVHLYRFVYYWSASTNSTNAYYLRIKHANSDKNLNPSSFGARAYGCSVRCLQE